MSRRNGIHVPTGRRAFSLVEMMVVLIIMGVLFAMAVPHYERSLEQSRADIAAANLRAIWSAQRMWWLTRHVYCDDLNELRDAGLIDPAVLATDGGYAYSLEDADANSFTATASRAAGARWSGTLSVDQTGTVTGAIQAAGEVDIVPGFQ